MKTTSLADVRQHLSAYIDEVVSTHERVTITRNGRPVAVLISADDLESLKETAFWASKGRPEDEDGETVSGDVVLAELAERNLRERTTDFTGKIEKAGEGPVRHGIGSGERPTDVRQ
jgi:prevent-host-death family protein